MPPPDLSPTRAAQSAALAAPEPEGPPSSIAPSSRLAPGSVRPSAHGPWSRLVNAHWFGRVRSRKPIGWRGALLLLTFACGFIALSSGVELTDRPGVSGAGVLTRLYYAIGLFVLGGLDLGMPTGGPSWARDLLWAVYFAAPAITASAVIEGVLKVLEPQAWRLSRLRGHVIVSGAGRLSMLYLRRLRSVNSSVPIVVVHSGKAESFLEQARDIYRAEIIQGEITSRTLLNQLRLDRASRVVLLNESDVSNLDAATRVLSLEPRLQGNIVVHVADLRFMLGMSHTLVAKSCDIFNAHQIAARHLVETRVRRHFNHTLPRDRIILAGFGRFGQTVLEELQLQAPRSFDRCLLIDSQVDRACAEFAEQVGFLDSYQRSCVQGDMRDPRVWAALDKEHQLSACEPVIVVGSGDDDTNLRTAIWLQKRFPRALVIARSFRPSLFADDVSRESGFEMVSIADLLTASMPASWFTRRARKG